MLDTHWLIEQCSFHHIWEKCEGWLIISNVGDNKAGEVLDPLMQCVPVSLTWCYSSSCFNLYLVISGMHRGGWGSLPPPPSLGQVRGNSSEDNFEDIRINTASQRVSQSVEIEFGPTTLKSCACYCWWWVSFSILPVREVLTNDLWEKYVMVSMSILVEGNHDNNDYFGHSYF